MVLFVINIFGGSVFLIVFIASKTGAHEMYYHSVISLECEAVEG